MNSSLPQYVGAATVFRETSQDKLMPLASCHVRDRRADACPARSKEAKEVIPLPRAPPDLRVRVVLPPQMDRDRVATRSIYPRKLAFDVLGCSCRRIEPQVAVVGLGRTRHGGGQGEDDDQCPSLHSIPPTDQVVVAATVTNVGVEGVCPAGVGLAESEQWSNTMLQRPLASSRIDYPC